MHIRRPARRTPPTATSEMKRAGSKGATRRSPSAAPLRSRAASPAPAPERAARAPAAGAPAPARAPRQPGQPLPWSLLLLLLCACALGTALLGLRAPSGAPQLQLQQQQQAPPPAAREQQAAPKAAAAAPPPGPAAQLPPQPTPPPQPPSPPLHAEPPQPTPASAPEPTPAPTPEPTPEPTPAPTPAPAPAAPALSPVALVMALTGMFDGGESCSVNTAAAAGEPGGAFNWLPLVLSLQEGWRRVIGLHTAASASNATVHMCNNVHALAVRRGGAALEISDRPLLSPAWLPPLQPAVERWRTEPMRQAFGEAPSGGAPAYSYAEQAGTILCELLQQQQFRFTHAARAALEARAAQAAASVADVLTAACQGPQAATSLLQLVLDAAEAPFEGTPAL